MSAVTGKDAKTASHPLTNDTVTALRVWLTEQPGSSGNPLFPTNRGGSMSSDALQQRLALHAAMAALTCPSLVGKNVTPHVLRHTAAMRPLHAGVDVTVIALWLGHENVNTANIYLQADLELTEKALARTTPPSTNPGRYHAPDPLVAFLEGL
jgi:integrase/recombinase XerD